MDISNQVKHFNSGTPVAVNRQDFTEEVQEKVIDYALNGRPISQQDVQEDRQNPGQHETQGDKVAITREQLERFQNIERIATDPEIQRRYNSFKDEANPSVNSTGEYSNPNKEAPSPATHEQPKSSNDIEDWLNATMDTPQDETRHEADRDQPFNQNQQNDNRKQDELDRNYKQALYRRSMKEGFDPRDFDKFVQDMNMDRMVQIYRGFKQGQSQQQAQPQPQAQPQAQPQSPAPQPGANLSEQNAPTDVSVYKGIGRGYNSRGTFDFGV
jgi:hypothetical protein